MLFAGLAKAVDCQAFVRHLNRLGLLPRRILGPAALATVAFECALGGALLLRLYLPYLLPVALGLTLALAGVGYWSTATGRADDCGCYNGAVVLSPRQSLLIDLAVSALLAGAWKVVGEEAGAAWKVAAVAVLTAAACGLAVLTQRRGRPLVELSPLRIGRRFNPRWLGGEAGRSATSGDKILIFLGATCPHCRKWVRVLNLAHQLEDLPQVLGAVGGTPDHSRLAASDAGAARFPVVALKPWRMAHLVRGTTPTVIVLRDGTILEKWTGALPAAYAERLRAEILARSASA
jgi:hypothetical protein